MINIDILLGYIHVLGEYIVYFNDKKSIADNPFIHAMFLLAYPWTAILLDICILYGTPNVLYLKIIIIKYCAILLYLLKYLFNLFLILSATDRLKILNQIMINLYVYIRTICDF